MCWVSIDSFLNALQFCFWMLSCTTKPSALKLAGVATSSGNLRHFCQFAVKRIIWWHSTQKMFVRAFKELPNGIKNKWISFKHKPLKLNQSSHFICKWKCSRTKEHRSHPYTPGSVCSNTHTHELTNWKPMASVVKGGSDTNATDTKHNRKRTTISDTPVWPRPLTHLHKWHQSTT